MHYCPMPSLRRKSVLGVPDACRQLRMLTSNADIVQANASRPMLLAALAGLPQPLVFHVRNTGNDLWLDRYLSVKANAIIAISQAVEKRFANSNMASKVCVIANGIDLRPFSVHHSKEEIRKQLGLPSDKSLIVYAGRLHVDKCIDVLIHAASRLRNANVAIFGEGPERAHLQKLVDVLGAPVHFIGKSNEIPQILAASDIVALPTRKEAFGRIALEAMAAARPVVASRVGGIPELVIDEETGILVPPEDPSALAHALQQLVSQPERAHSMGLAGRRRVATQFSAQQHFARVHRLYQDLLAQRMR